MIKIKIFGWIIKSKKALNIFLVLGSPDPVLWGIYIRQVLAGDA